MLVVFCFLPEHVKRCKTTTTCLPVSSESGPACFAGGGGAGALGARLGGTREPSARTNIECVLEIT